MKILNLKVMKGAIKNLRYHVMGKCNICGKCTIFVCTSLIAVHRNMTCLFCRSTSRNRHIAKMLIDEVAKGISSISEIPKRNNCKIYNTDPDDVFSKILHNYGSYISSGFFPDIKFGTEIKERVFCQNLENLTFKDDTFDVAISEHVFEHVRDYEKGFREIFRILKCGGYHIFSIPFFFDKKTLIRTDTSGDEDVQILPPEYHGDSIRGKILAYRKFGIDMFDLLNSIGFYTKLNISKYADLSHGIVDSEVFVSKKLVKEPL